MEIDDFTATQSQKQRLDAQVLSAEGAPQIAGYQLEDLKGRGSFGEVWSARQLSSGQKVAVKIFRARAGASWTYFGAEVERHSLVAEHPNIVTLLDADLECDPPYFVMNLYPGSLADHSRAPVKAVVRWLEQIARALRHTHQRGLLHCDLKPSNVLLDVEEQAQLADFGQAVLRSQETRSLGSLGFMAPEQAESGAVPDVRWDVYALGATAYFLLSGQRPRLSDERIRSTTPGDLLADYRGHLGPLAPLTIDADLWQLLESCLQLDPARRPEGMGEVIDDLERRRKRRPLLCRRPWSSAYLARRFVQRNALSVIFSAILVGVLLTGLGLYYGESERNRVQLAEELFNRGWDSSSEGETAQAYLLWAQAVARAPERTEYQRATRDYPFPLLHSWRHAGEVHQLAFSPDGKLLLAGDVKGGASLWNLADGKVVAEIPGPTSPPEGKQYLDEERVLHVADFAPDGRHFATARPVRIWDAQGRLVKECGPGDQVIWSPDSQTLAAQNADSIQLYDATGQPVRKLDCPAARGLRFSPDSRMVLSWGGPDSVGLGQQPVSLWRVSDGLQVQKLPHGQFANFDAQGQRVVVCNGPKVQICSLEGKPIRSLTVPPPSSLAAFSQDGQRLVVASLLGELGVYSVEHGDLVVPLKRSRWTPLDVRFCHGDRDILSYSYYSLARIWDAASGAPRSPSFVNEGTLTSAVLSPDEKCLATATAGGTVRLFRLDQQDPPWLRELKLENASGDEWDMVAFAPEGKALFNWRHASGTLSVLEPSSGKLLFPKFEGGANENDGRASFSHNGRYIALAGRAPQVLDMATGKPLGPPLPPSSDGYFLSAVSSDGTRLATLEWNRRVTFWNVATGKPEGKSRMAPRVPVSGCFSPDGGQLFVGTMNSTVYRLKWPDGELQPFFEHGMFICSMLVSADGRLLFTGSGDGTARLWNSGDGRPDGPPLAHPAAVVDLAISPGGDRLATACLDGRVRLWSRSGQPLLAPLPHPRVHAAAFSPDGRTLMTASYDSIRFWDAGLDSRESPEHLKLRLEIETGMQLDGQSLRPLGFQELEDLRRQLRQ